MRIAVIGAGGVGGYLGGRLAAAGEEVGFVARGAHAAAMRQHGLRVLSPLGDAVVQPVTLIDDLEAAGWWDVILLATKMYDLPAAAERARLLVHAETAVVPLQNGVESASILAAYMPKRHICAGVVYIAADLAEPGVVRHNGVEPRVAFGELTGETSWRLDALEAACAGAGIKATQTDAIEVEQWRKFALLAPFATATCLARAPIGIVRDDPERQRQLAELVAETVAVGRACVAALPEDLAASTLTFMAQLPPTMKSSMLQDLEAGRPLELAWLTGAVLRLGREADVATPATQRAYDALAGTEGERPRA